MTQPSPLQSDDLVVLGDYDDVRRHVSVAGVAFETAPTPRGSTTPVPSGTGISPSQAFPSGEDSAVTSGLTSSLASSGEGTSEEEEEGDISKEKLDQAWEEWQNESEENQKAWITEMKCKFQNDKKLRVDQLEEPDRLRRVAIIVRGAALGGDLWKSEQQAAVWESEFTRMEAVYIRKGMKWKSAEDLKKERMQYLLVYEAINSMKEHFEKWATSDPVRKAKTGNKKDDGWGYQLHREPFDESNMGEVTIDNAETCASQFFQTTLFRYKNIDMEWIKDFVYDRRSAMHYQNLYNKKLYAMYAMQDMSAHDSEKWLTTRLRYPWNAKGKGAREDQSSYVEAEIKALEVLRKLDKYEENSAEVRCRFSESTRWVLNKRVNRIDLDSKSDAVGEASDEVAASGGDAVVEASDEVAASGGDAAVEASDEVAKKSKLMSKLMRTPLGSKKLYEKICKKLLNKLFKVNRSQVQEKKREDAAFKVIERIFTKSRATLFIGPPCCGKSHFMDALAASIVEDTEDQVECVSFSSSYCYEDFIQKFNPYGDTQQILDGPFMRMYEKAREANAIICRDVVEKAWKNGDNAEEEAFKALKAHKRRVFVLTIDEFNRADVQDVLGELYAALDGNDRNITLKYSTTETKKRINLAEVPNLVILASMNEFEEGAGPIEPSLLRRVHKWRFSVTRKHPGYLEEFSGQGLLQMIATPESHELAKQLDDFLLRINQDDCAKGDERLSQHGIPTGYFVELFKKEASVTKTDICGTWDYEVIPILNKLTNEITVNGLQKKFDDRFRPDQQS